MHRFELGSESITGNADIDEHHRILFDLANEVLFGQVADRGPEDLRHAVSFLFSYLEYHFASEELTMREHGYPSSRFHSAFHDHIRREAETIATSLGRRYFLEEVRSSIFFLLEDWAVYHVGHADRQLAEFLRNEAAAGRAPHPPSGDRPTPPSPTGSDPEIPAAASGPRR
jgi:hemerythrin